MSKTSDAKGDAKHSDTKRDDDRIHVPGEVRDALKDYARVERERQDNPVIAEMISWKSLANHILRNEVERRGYLKRVERKKEQAGGNRSGGSS